MRLRLVLIAAGLVPLSAAAGCSGGALPTRPAAGARAPAAPVPAQRPRAPLRARIILAPRTIRAGSHVTAHVVVENGTGHAIRAAGCGSLFQIALVSSRYHPVVAWLTCLRIFTIPAGASRYRAAVIASYSTCTRDRPQPGLRRCLPSGGLPPLPPGVYHATVFQSGQVIPPPAPVAVRVTPP